MTEESQRPRASFRIVCDDLLESGKRRVGVEIVMDRPLNGFDGTTLSFELDPTMTHEAVIVFFKERVKWKVDQQTGVEYAAEEIVHQGDDMPPVEPVSTVDPASDDEPPVRAAAGDESDAEHPLEEKPWTM